jgi:CheY-like chemotaxis protein
VPLASFTAEAVETGRSGPADEPCDAVLVAHPAAPTARLVRETLEQFAGAKVFATGDPLRAFELALQRRYALFLFAMRFGELTGPTLYELISMACAAGRGPRLVAPAVIFVREKDEPKPPESLARDVRVKAILGKPIRIERLLDSVGGVLEIRDPTLGETSPRPHSGQA